MARENSSCQLRVRYRAAEDEASDLRCDVSAPGSVGGFTWTQLAGALRVEEAVCRATARAEAIFRVEIAPYCPEIF
jgi:hypothetical protein